MTSLRRSAASQDVAPVTSLVALLIAAVATITVANGRCHCVGVWGCERARVCAEDRTASERCREKGGRETSINPIRWCHLELLNSVNIPGELWLLFPSARSLPLLPSQLLPHLNCSARFVFWGPLWHLYTLQLLFFCLFLCWVFLRASRSFEFSWFRLQSQLLNLLHGLERTVSRWIVAGRQTFGGNLPLGHFIRHRAQGQAPDSDVFCQPVELPSLVCGFSLAWPLTPDMKETFCRTLDLSRGGCNVAIIPGDQWWTLKSCFLPYIDESSWRCRVQL